MKRFLSMGLAVVVALLIIGTALAVTRPEWLPAGLLARLPFAAKGQSSGSENAGLYCKEHGVPEKFCTLCHEELIKTLPLCEEHGKIPEDICTLCHPEAEKQYKLEMCPEGHGLPREFCFKCGKGNTAAANEPDDGWCATHNKPEENCEECKLDPKSHEGTTGGLKICRLPLPMVRLASSRLAHQVGIQTAKVTEESHAHKLIANAEVAYDANHYADITPRVVGFLREVRADLGHKVKQGDLLAMVDSPEVSGAKAQYITARAAVSLAQATNERTKMLAQSGAIPGKTELEALTGLNQARASSLDAEQRLRNFGFKDDDLEQIVKENDTKSLLKVVSPLDGVVVARHAVKGEPVQATSQLFAVTDISTLWLWIDIYEADIASVMPGQKISFRVSGNDLPPFAGTVNWVGTEVNVQTRTTRIRAELANSEGRLRANQFGQAEIQVGEEHQAVVVPKAAVQRKDGVDLVFLPQEEVGVYRPQRVMVKPTDHGDVLEVAWGLRPGQRVVTRGAFLLKTEIMKGAIGAGCCK